MYEIPKNALETALNVEKYFAEVNILPQQVSEEAINLIYLKSPYSTQTLIATPNSLQYYRFSYNKYLLYYTPIT
jgi:hypothetical protein